MNYLDWNNLISKYFFDSSMEGREVLLYINNDTIDKIGETHGVGVDDYINSVINGPPWVTSKVFCRKALQTFKNWRQRSLDYPPYISYLSFFVLSAVTETEYASHAYYPRLRKLLNEPLDEGMPPEFDKMYLLWDDLEKWSREDKHEEFGRFVARIRGGWINVGLPRSQTLLSEKERSHLPDIFAEALLDPTDPPIAEDIPNILKQYGHSFLQNRTKHLIESGKQEDKVLTKALVELILDELEAWDGSLSDDTSGDSIYKKHQAYLRLCLRIDNMADRADIFVRLRTNKLIPEYGLQLIRQSDSSLWHCDESHRGWSKPLKIPDSSPSQYMDGASLKWSSGEQFNDLEQIWSVYMPMAHLRLFRLRIDGLPDWIETRKLERNTEFLVACTKEFDKKVYSWGQEACELFKPLKLSGLPEGWVLFRGKNATKSCTGIRALTLSALFRIHLVDGVKINKSNAYFDFAPPKIKLENSIGTERVTVNDKLLKPEGNQLQIFTLPNGLTCNTPIQIEVSFDEQIIRKYIRLEQFELTDSFDETMFRNDLGELCSYNTTVKVIGAMSYGMDEEIDNLSLDIKQLDVTTIFIGAIPGEISNWPSEPYPDSWHPTWAILKLNPKKWEIIYCGGSEYLNVLPRQKKNPNSRRMIMLWKEALWNFRKRYNPPEIEIIRVLWNHYLKVAKNV